MNALHGLLDWWNLIFALPIALSILLLVVSAVGGLESEAEGHVDVDAHADIDAHADVDGHAEFDGPADVDGEAYTDADGDDHAHEHPLADALKWVGIGVVPISLLAQGFMLFFGIFGLSMNRILNVSSHPEAAIWGSLAVATLAGMGSAGIMGALGRRFLPQAKPATSSRDLVGRVGQVVFPVSLVSGTIQVRDASGALHQVAARLASGRESLEGGREIIVTGYNAEAGAFLVDESPFTLTAEDLKRR